MSDYTDKRKAIRARGIAKAVTVITQTVGLYTQPEPGRILGLDTSHWTGIVDWEKAKANGIVFAIIKYMDGIVRTRYATNNYVGAKDAGIFVGSYQWLRHKDEVSPGGQARAYADMLISFPTDLTPAVDFEWSPNGKKFNVGITELYGFVEPFANTTGAYPMIYTAPGYWDQYGSHSIYWRRFKLWQAQYKRKQPDPIAPFAPCTFWQFTETGEGARYGIPRDGEKACDMNYFMGTMEELRNVKP